MKHNRRRSPRSSRRSSSVLDRIQIDVEVSTAARPSTTSPCRPIGTRPPSSPSRERLRRVARAHHEPTGVDVS